MQKCFKVLGRAEDERVRNASTLGSRGEKCARFPYKCLIPLSVNACSLKHRGGILTTKSHLHKVPNTYHCVLTFIWEPVTAAAAAAPLQKHRTEQFYKNQPSPERWCPRSGDQPPSREQDRGGP